MVTSTWSLRPTALSAFCTWLTWERWSGLVGLRTADWLTPNPPAGTLKTLFDHDLLVSHCETARHGVWCAPQIL